MNGYIFGIIAGTAVIVAFVTYVLTSDSIKRKQREIKRYENDKREKEQEIKMEYSNARKEIEKRNQSKRGYYELHIFSNLFR